MADATVLSPAEEEARAKATPHLHEPRLVTSRDVTGEGVLDHIADFVNKLIGSMYLFVAITVGIVVWLFAGNIVGFDKTPWPLLLTLLNLPQLSIMISLQVSANRAQAASDAKALAEALPNVEVLTPPLGHIGMVVGHGAPDAVWKKLAEWVKILKRGSVS